MRPAHCASCWGDTIGWRSIVCFWTTTGGVTRGGGRRRSSWAATTPGMSRTRPWSTGGNCGSGRPQLSTSAEAIDPEAWIDPEVQALAGIDATELARYTNPPRNPATAQAVPQPELAGPGPHMSNYSEGVYEAIMNMPDEELFERMSETEPPVSG